jgi:hypothetical protein
LNGEECRALVTALSDIERRRESLDAVQSRDRAWSEHAFGWSGHFFYLLQDLTDYPEPNLSARQAVQRTQAIARLLMVTSAARGYQLKHGNPPDRVEQLTPEFLTVVPADPFDPNGGALRCLRTEDGPLAYSVGFDGDDDGGRPPADGDTGELYYGDGDFRLDDYLADEPDASATTTESLDEPASEDPAAE